VKSEGKKDQEKHGKKSMEVSRERKRNQNKGPILGVRRKKKRGLSIHTFISKKTKEISGRWG